MKEIKVLAADIEVNEKVDALYNMLNNLSMLVEHSHGLLKEVIESNDRLKSAINNNTKK